LSEKYLKLRCRDTTHAVEMTLPLITAAATQRRSRNARDGHD